MPIQAIERGLGFEVIKLLLCSTQLSMKFFMLINLLLLRIVNSFLLNIVEHEYLSANKYENAIYCSQFHIYQLFTVSYLSEAKMSWSAELSMKKKAL